MILGINGATTMKADLPTDVAAAGMAGFGVIEIWAEKLDRFLEDRSLSDLRNLLDAAGVGPASINSLESVTFRSEADFRAVRQRCEHLCTLAGRLGCPTLVVVPSATPAAGATDEEIRHESVRVLRELAAIAEAHGVRLAFEFLGFPWCSVRTLEDCRRIVEATGRDAVGLVIDTCHFHAGGSSLDSIEATAPDRVFLLHLNDVEDRPRETIEDAHRLLPGEGVIPLDAILGRLERIGFDGVCSVELFRPAYWERDPEELSRAAHGAACEVLKDRFTLGRP